MNFTHFLLCYSRKEEISIEPTPLEPESVWFKKQVHNYFGGQVPKEFWGPGSLCHIRELINGFKVMAGATTWEELEKKEEEEEKKMWG